MERSGVKPSLLSRLVAVLVPQDATFADLRLCQADVQRDLEHGTG